MNAYFYSHVSPLPSHPPRPVHVPATVAATPAAQHHQQQQRHDPLNERTQSSSLRDDPLQPTTTTATPRGHLTAGITTLPYAAPTSPAPRVQDSRLFSTSSRDERTGSEEEKVSAPVAGVGPVPAPSQRLSAPTAPAMPCLVLFSPQGPRPLDGLTTTTTSSKELPATRHGPLRNRTSSANRLSNRGDPRKDGAAAGQWRRPPIADGIRCVYDRDTRSQLLHIAAGTEVDFSAFMRLSHHPRSSAGNAAAVSAASHPVLAVQLCVAAPVLTAADQQQQQQQRAEGHTGVSSLPSVTVSPPGSLYVELVVRTGAAVTSSGVVGSGSGSYRLRFTNAVHSVQHHAHHTRFPLQCVRTAQWVQLFIDVEGVMRACQACGVVAAAAANTSAHTVFRIHQLRIGTAAMVLTQGGGGADSHTKRSSSSGGGGSGGLYIRRIVAGHGLPLPPSSVDRLLHPAGQFSVTVPLRGDDTRDSGQPVWTLPESLRLPAEAGESCSVFVRTGEEDVLRVPPAPPRAVGEPPSTTSSLEKEQRHHARETPPLPPAPVAAARRSAVAEGATRPGVERRHKDSPSSALLGRPAAPLSSGPLSTPPLAPHTTAATSSGLRSPPVHPPLGEEALPNAQASAMTHHLQHPQQEQRSAGHRRRSEAQKERLRQHFTALELLRTQQAQLQGQRTAVAHRSVSQTSSSTSAQKQDLAVNSRVPAVLSQPSSSSAFPFGAAVSGGDAAAASTSSRSPSDAEVFVVREVASADQLASDTPHEDVYNARTMGSAPPSIPLPSTPSPQLPSQQQQQQHYYVPDTTVAPGAPLNADGLAESENTQDESNGLDAVSQPQRQQSGRPSSSSSPAAPSAAWTATLFTAADSAAPPTLAVTHAPRASVASPPPSATPQLRKSSDFQEGETAGAADGDDKVSEDASLAVSDVSSSCSSSLSQTSAVVQLMQAMSARVRRIHDVLLENQAAVDNTATLATAATATAAAGAAKRAALVNAVKSAEPVVVHTESSNAEDGKDKTDATPSAVDGEKQQNPPTRHHQSSQVPGAATPLSLLSAVVTTKGRAGAPQSAAFLKGNSHDAGEEEEEKSAAAQLGNVTPSAAGDSKAVLELWNSTEVPLHLPDFASQPSLPLPKDMNTFDLVTPHTAGNPCTPVSPAGKENDEHTTETVVDDAEGDVAPAARADVATALPTQDSAATSWTFQSASVDPTAATTATASASVASPAAALPREYDTTAVPTRTQRPSTVPHSAALPASAGLADGGRGAAPTTTTTTRAVVWRRPTPATCTAAAAAVVGRPLRAEGGATQRALNDEVRLGDDTPVVMRPQRTMRGESAPDADAVTSSDQRDVVTEREQQRAQPFAASSAARALTSGEDATVRTPPRAPTWGDTAHQADNNARLLLRQEMASEAQSTTALSDAARKTMSATHHSASTISSFHMWLPHPMPPLSASRVRYPPSTTPSTSGGVQGSTSTSSSIHSKGHHPVKSTTSGSHDHRPSVHFDAEGTVGSRAPPPVVRLSAAVPSVGVHAKSSAVPLPLAPAAGKQVHHATAAAAAAAGTAGKDAQERSGVKGEEGRYIYDGVLQCFLDLETNAYVDMAA